MFNILVKKTGDFLISCLLSSAVGSLLVGRSQKTYNRPVEVCFLVDSATFCSILKLSCDLIRRYIVLYFFTQKATCPADLS